MGASWATSHLYRVEPSNKASWMSRGAAVLWGSAASSLPCGQVEVPPVTIGLPVLFWFRTASLLQTATPFDHFLLIKWQKGIPFPADPSLPLLPAGEGGMQAARRFAGRTGAALLWAGISSLELQIPLLAGVPLPASRCPVPASPPWWQRLPRSCGTAARRAELRGVRTGRCSGSSWLHARCKRPA